MASLTIRDIPDDLLAELRRRAQAERRSLNSQILVFLEDTLRPIGPVGTVHRLTADAQVALWTKLADEWEDPRSPEEIAADIRAHRTGGREVTL